MKKETSTIITLSQPIKRGDKEITEITVNKPTVPALKGLKLMDVFSTDVDAIRVLLPRVTQPVLHKTDFDSMEIADFVELAGAAVGFLGKNSATETETEEPTE